MTSQLSRFRCLFLSCRKAAVTSLRSFLFRDDFSLKISSKDCDYKIYMKKIQNCRDEGKNSVETIKNGVIRNGKTSQNNYEASSVPWMPCSVLGASIFLGNLDQARNPTVIKDLGITHIVSIGR